MCMLLSVTSRITSNTAIVKCRLRSRVAQSLTRLWLWKRCFLAGHEAWCMGYGGVSDCSRVAWQRTNDMSNEGKKTREALITAHRLSITATSSIAGDIPSLMACAYQRHFNEEIPLRSGVLSALRTFIHNHTTTDALQDGHDLESLIATLSEIPPLEPSAQALLDRARSILTSGPRLSMNIVLAEGEELPVALHTLLQGTIWATLLHGGVDPDLGMTNEKATEHHMRRRDSDKFPWFLCRKFFFVHEVASRDCQSHWATIQCPAWRMLYAGRLFERSHPNPIVPDLAPQDTGFSWIRAPPIVSIFNMDCDSFLLLATPHGIYSYEKSTLFFSVSGRFPRDHELPARVDFANCPSVSGLERQLPLWHKHQVLVDMAADAFGCVVLTPAGVAAAGGVQDFMLGDTDNEVGENVADAYFLPVPLPARFVPTRLIADIDLDVFILSMGDRQMIAGSNWRSRLGIADEHGTFVNLPFHVDQIVFVEETFCIFRDGKTLLFAGAIHDIFVNPSMISFETVETTHPHPTQFKTPVSRLFMDRRDLLAAAVVAEGKTHCALMCLPPGITDVEPGPHSAALSVCHRVLSFEVTSVALLGTHSSRLLLQRPVEGKDTWVTVDLMTSEDPTPVDRTTLDRTPFILDELPLV
ncbi:hypothetical protein J8273_3471 [Carpediemonas membranifera]|uniref:Uncharacterized protein n=1 Tax=Carpediemonas membranifera TaxID=201153 RepID=A0A8J6E3L3_9EUKA|nr:hypothetical protein J8273_3471 [Carpediemonas membranifera]|eukprot:KAG9393337.1 hypothetical protein J8273_3471 [Carpediemonas membranifera]